MTYTVRYVLRDPGAGEDRSFAADSQDLIEAHLEPFIAAGTLVQAYVYDGSGAVIAESHPGASNLRAVPGTAGWTDRD